MKILEFYPTDAQKKRAQKLADDFKVNKKSIFNGERNLYAFLGEVVVGDFLKEKGWVLHPKDMGIYDFDILDPSGVKWEIKTKMTTTKPKADFNCTTYTYREQKCDGYIFTRCLKTLEKVWLLGWISKKDFEKYGTFYKSGDRDGNLIMTQDCLGITIAKLNPFVV